MIRYGRRIRRAAHDPAGDGTSGRFTRTSSDDGCPAQAATVEEDEVNGVTTTPILAVAPSAPWPGGLPVTPRRSVRAGVPAKDGRAA
ncbi:hypothetical protein [Frankia gtarii]|uniref:hypothetical protein n=1 Tax=Frankia gtarii TaxID=2950102 RepID=UPI0021C02C9D|nr:hypothetical protein [Frankia gtarii]